MIRMFTPIRKEDKPVTPYKMHKEFTVQNYAGSNTATDLGIMQLEAITGSLQGFASNGRPVYGKADIYKCQILGDSVYDIQIIPYPINTAGDDIHFERSPFDARMGWLDSKRSGGQGDEES